MFDFLMTSRVHVKPHGNKWQVVRQSTIESFFDDLFSFGLGVAVYNLVWLWRNRTKK